MVLIMMEFIGATWLGLVLRLKGVKIIKKTKVRPYAKGNFILTGQRHSEQKSKNNNKKNGKYR